MGMDTIELDTRDEDKARTEGRLAEYYDEDEGASCPDCGCKVTYQYDDNGEMDKCSACGKIFYSYF